MDALDRFLTNALWFVIGAGAMAVFGFLVNANTPPQHYFENVCTYEGGVVKEDVCIVDGQVFEIKEP